MHRSVEVRRAFCRLMILLWLADASAVAAESRIPFPAALDGAAVSQDRLDDLCKRSLILGNGDANGLLYSQGKTLILRLTKNDVWDARIDTSEDPPLTTIGIADWTTNGSEGSWSSWRKPYPCPVACAQVVLEFTGDDDQRADVATLDLHRALARVSGGANEDSRADVRALAQRNVFLIHSSATARLKPLGASWLPVPKHGNQNGVEWIHQDIPGDPDWPGMSFAVALASCENRKAAAIATSREAVDPVAEAVALAQQSLAEDDAQLIAEHETAWRKFWSASGVSLDDPELQNLWYRNLYFLRCVSKPGVVAAGLFAGLVRDKVAWHGGHTINYNAQQSFQAAFSSNHVELAQPFEQMVLNHLPRARWLARKTYNCGGAFFPHNLYPYEPTDPESCRSKNNRFHVCTPWAHTIGNSGFLMQNLWWRYLYQPERKYLEAIAYPAIRDVATFYADFMDQCREDADGNVILAPSVSPEHWGWTPNMERNRNCAYDLAFVRFTFQAAIEAAGILGSDGELAARWKSQLDRLPDYPTTKDAAPLVVDVEGAPPIVYNIAVPAVPVFPGEQITWFSPEAQKLLFARTIDGLRWNGNNSLIMLGIARARLSMPGAWQWLKDEAASRLRANGTLALNRLEPRNHGINSLGHYTEQFAATAAVGELLLQSVGGCVRVFPAWPQEKSARFENLRAQGGFLVSAEQAEGRVQHLCITSTSGGLLRLLSPWPAVAVTSSSHRTLSVEPDGRGIVEIATESGETLCFSGRK